MSEEEILYLLIGKSIPNSVKSQLFGKPCFKINGKAFICFYQNAMVFKLEAEIHQEALSHDGSQLFSPSGKKSPMKEWVQVPLDYQIYWYKYAEKAMKYVLENS
jgi:hypothetical protein